MLNKMSTLFLALLFAGSLLAQSQPMKKAPLAVEPNVAAKNINVPNVATSKAAANWVLVDSMGNIYGPAIGTINPLAYDPYTNVTAFVHRSLAAFGGSGMLVYNISTDKGATWSRILPGINNGSSVTARYPAMAISNPTKSANVADAIAVFAWPVLLNGGFDGVGFGADAPIGQGAPFAGLIDHDGAYSSQNPIWAAQDNDKVFWTAEYSTVPEANPFWQARLFSTSDFATVDSSTPYSFQDSLMGGMIVFGGASKGNNVFIAGAASGELNGVDTSNVLTSGWYPVVMKSTDKGATWTNWEAIDFRKINTLKNYDRLFDYTKGDAFISYGGDVNIDKDGRIHIVTSLTDTTIDGNTGKNAIVEIYQTATGWDGKVIHEGINDNTYTWCSDRDPALGQMGPSPYLAVSKAGDAFACQWVMPPTITDSICDIFISTRTLTGNWSTTLHNITATPIMNENSSHFAPYLEGSGTSYTAFSQYSYEKGNATDSIVQTNVANVYCAAVPLIIDGIDAKNGAGVNSYALEQNYPNPFNPSTTIRFNMAVTGSVSLKVYDVLGREVANLVSGQMSQGSHSVSFDGSNLASGLYICKLEASNFTATQKMMLLK
ncbi:MAG: T9SS type A sorting domain-containing protein [Ignavibacteriales bacterium]|nr:T9SS type A sorting domain-containing protein [Ignavibacteriales bacterium]